MAKYDDYIGTKAIDGNAKVMPSITVEGITVTSNTNRVGIGGGRFVCTIGTGNHPLIAEIRASVKKPTKTKATKKVITDDSTT